MCELFGAMIIPTTQTFPDVNVQQFLKNKVHLYDRGTRDLLFSYEKICKNLKEGRYKTDSYVF